VSEIFNNFFINVAKDIGSSNIKSDESHPSISKIIANTPDIENLVFHDIKEDFIIKQINKINIKKQLDEMASRQLLLLLDKKGFIVGQKSLDFGPPRHLS
jgi:hypothetical protein